MTFDFQSRPVGGHTSLMAPFSYNYGSRTLSLITNMAGLKVSKRDSKERHQPAQQHIHFRASLKAKLTLYT
jgi:hypothetical protein